MAKSGSGLLKSLLAAKENAGKVHSLTKPAFLQGAVGGMLRAVPPLPLYHGCLRAGSQPGHLSSTISGKARAAMLDRLALMDVWSARHPHYSRAPGARESDARGSRGTLGQSAPSGASPVVQSLSLPLFSVEGRLAHEGYVVAVRAAHQAVGLRRWVARHHVAAASFARWERHPRTGPPESPRCQPRA